MGIFFALGSKVTAGGLWKRDSLVDTRAGRYMDSERGDGQEQPITAVTPAGMPYEKRLCFVSSSANLHRGLFSLLNFGAPMKVGLWKEDTGVFVNSQ